MRLIRVLNIIKHYICFCKYINWLLVFFEIISIVLYLVAVLNFDALTGKLNVPYEPNLHFYRDCWLSCLALMHWLPKGKLLVFFQTPGFWPTKTVKLMSCLFMLINVMLTLLTFLKQEKGRQTLGLDVFGVGIRLYICIAPSAMTLCPVQTLSVDWSANVHMQWQGRWWQLWPYLIDEI